MIRLPALLLISFCTIVGCRTFSWKYGPSRWAGVSRSNAHRADIPEDLRSKLVSRATELLEDEEERPEFGATDLGRILVELKIDLDWQSKHGIDALVRSAQKKQAYSAEGEPRPGDIVLFHNQRDVNGNGENDDWHTGLGIVIKSRGDRFEAVTRTGHAPRRIHVCPNSPSFRMVGGKLVNSFVRIPQKSDPGDTAYLAGQLYAGYIDIDKLLAP